MAFNATTQMTAQAAVITLTGELDAASALLFREAVEQAAVAQPAHLVLEMSGLDFMASAGLRVLIFAKQKMGTTVDIYVVAPQEMVLDTLIKTGFDQSVMIVDRYQVAA